MNKGAKIMIGIIIVAISLIVLGKGLNNIYKSKVELDVAQAELKQACYTRMHQASMLPRLIMI
jgi:hypothetical protein